MSEGATLSSASAASVSAALSASSGIQLAIFSANSVVAAAQASAASAVASANSYVADARATATFAAAEAQATISQVNVQASASVLAFSIGIMTETRFALTLTSSITGLSIVSILAYFLLLRYRKRRLAAKNKEADTVRGSTSSSSGHSVSEFSHPRKSEWSFARNSQPPKDPHPGTEGKVPDELIRAHFSNINPTRKPEGSTRHPFADPGLYSLREERDGGWEGPRPSFERKNTLIYDTELPDQPSKLTSILVESLRSVRSFGNQRSKDIKSVGTSGKRMSDSRKSKLILDDEGSEIGTAL